MAQAPDPAVADLSRNLAQSLAGRPLIVALDGSVAAGKSRLAAQLAEQLDALGAPTAVVAADGFLLPLAQMRQAGLVDRKGFPESFDRPAMRGFLEALRRGAAPSAPAYAHETYDISPDVRQPTAGAAVVIFEGVNVLAPDLADLYDRRLFLDAPHAKAWFMARFIQTPFSPARRAALARWRPADGDANAWAEAVWAAVNGRNLELHIESGRARADTVLRADAGHRISL